MSDPVQLSVRQPRKDSGGPVVPVRVESGRLDGRSELLILVHGYNNSRTVALQSYGQFLDKLKQKFGTLTAQVVEFHWPGDEPNKIISALSYPNQIQPAIDSARELASFLGGLQRAGPLLINLVGHSLGCRVVLELLAHWTGGLSPGTFIGTIVLMAAAAKVRAVDAGGVLRAAATLTLRNPVLYSKGDAVLHWAFPLGETAAGEGFFPTAVGRTGGPGIQVDDDQFHGAGVIAADYPGTHVTRADYVNVLLENGNIRSYPYEHVRHADKKPARQDQLRRAAKQVRLKLSYRKLK